MNQLKNKDSKTHFKINSDSVNLHKLMMVLENEVQNGKVSKYAFEGYKRELGRVGIHV
jgi:hypothetical protein